jgi:transcriptional regulator with XRE-family HTH domain
MDKTAIAKKIVHYRKLKGITQEALSELTGLNVRTIQRIESGEVDPRLFTLKSIADALGVNLEELLPEPTQHELNQIAVLHITPAGFFLLPVVGNVLLPFIFWMLKREEINGINRHGKDILNGQLTYSLIIGVIIAAVMGMAFSQIFFPGNQFFLIFFMHLPVYMVIGLILSFIAFGILPAINAFRVSNGKKPWGYPFKIIFFK